VELGAIVDGLTDEGEEPVDVVPRAPLGDRYKSGEVRILPICFDTSRPPG
jgi:hypothetical protein